MTKNKTDKIIHKISLLFSKIHKARRGKPNLYVAPHTALTYPIDSRLVRCLKMMQHCAKFVRPIKRGDDGSYRGSNQAFAKFFNSLWHHLAGYS